MVHFKLKDLNNIIPVGQEPDLHLSWFWLTDGDLWLNFGENAIYEYSKEALVYFGNKPTAYNDYYLVRFLEDFSTIFEKISEPVPEKIYTLTKDLTQFLSDTKKWLDIYDTNEDEYSDFYFEEYDSLISWIYQRSFDSAHLIGGPHLYFFRCNDRIRIVWDTEHVLENGISLWTAKNGSFEMSYTDFVDNIKTFGDSFFYAMDKQIELAIAKEWGNIRIDKQRLAEEHRERGEEFDTKLNLLTREPAMKTDWIAIEKLYHRMIAEI